MLNNIRRVWPSFSPLESVMAFMPSLFRVKQKVIKDTIYNR